MKYFLMVLCITFLLTGCGDGGRSEEWNRWKTDNGKVKVLTTIAMVADLVRGVGGDHVDTLVLIKGSLDPHSYQLVKGDDEKFSSAQLIFFNGLGLEHGPSLQHQLYNDSKAWGLGDKIRQKDPQRILTFKNQIDPHIWMDVSLWAEGIPFIVEALSLRDPVHSEEYRNNGALLTEKMNEAHRQINEEMAKIPDEKRFLVTSHDAFNYFTKAYLATDQERQTGEWQHRFAAPEGLAPESQLSATDIQQIIDHLSQYHIEVVFPESNVSKDSIRKIVQAAKEKGVDVHMADTFLYADAMGDPGTDGDTYLKMIWHNVKTITHFLSQRKNHDQ